MAGKLFRQVKLYDAGIITLLLNSHAYFLCVEGVQGLNRKVASFTPQSLAREKKFVGELARGCKIARPKA